MTLIARDGCSSTLYAEVSVSDKAGTALRYSNVSVGSVTPGQRANLVFENTDGASAEMARLTTVTCR